MLQAARLWEKTSAGDRKYLVGRWGGLRILVLQNRERGGAGQPDWHLVLTEASPSSGDGP
jgi:hypothetical protein